MNFSRGLQDARRRDCRCYFLLPGLELSSIGKFLVRIKFYFCGVKFCIFILTAILFSACAPALYQADALGESAPMATENAAPVYFSATKDGDTVSVPLQLQHAYAHHLNGAISAGCTLHLSFAGDVREHYASPWYFGILLLAPLWPAMPREDDISIRLAAELICEGVKVQSATLWEEEHPRLFWYGPYRNGYMQEHADMVHRKLVARLKQSLLQNFPADESIRSDIY